MSKTAIIKHGSVCKCLWLGCLFMKLHIVCMQGPAYVPTFHQGAGLPMLGVQMLAPPVQVNTYAQSPTLTSIGLDNAEHATTAVLAHLGE